MQSTKLQDSNLGGYPTAKLNTYHIIEIYLYSSLYVVYHLQSLFVYLILKPDQ